MRKYLKELRKNKAVSQSDTAKALRISQGYYCVIENGTRGTLLDLRLLVRIADYFNVDMQWLINQELEFDNTTNKGA